MTYNDRLRGKARRILPIYKDTEAWTDKVASIATCRRGCTHCCHIAVTSHLAEGVAIADYLQNSPTWRPRFAAIMRAVDGWISGARGGKTDAELAGPPCPFLSESGDCGIYPVRPLACRLYFVASDPEFCSTLKRPGHAVAVLDARLVAAMTWEAAAEAAGPALFKGAFYLPHAVRAGFEMLRRTPRGFRKWLREAEARGDHGDVREGCQ